MGHLLKTVCSDIKDKTKYYFKYINANVSYSCNGRTASNTHDGFAYKFTDACHDDNLSYQLCEHRHQIKKSYKCGTVLCGTYKCVDERKRIKLIICFSADCTVMKASCHDRWVKI